MNVTAQAIRHVIQEMHSSGRSIRGVLVRRELKTRFGTPGGTDRVYALIREFKETQTPISSGEPAVDRDRDDAREQIEILTRELLAERARAELAEERELRHQEKWAVAVDALRQELASRGRGGRFEESTERLNLLRELMAANNEIRWLKERLAEMGDTDRGYSKDVLNESGSYESSPSR